MSTNSGREYVPIEPGGDVDPIGSRLLAEFRAAPIRQRFVLPVYLVISTFGGLYGGYALTSAYSNWITWSVPRQAWINPPVEKTTPQDGPGSTIVTPGNPWDPSSGAGSSGIIAASITTTSSTTASTSQVTH